MSQARVIAFTGYAGAGKTTAAKYLVERSLMRRGKALRLSLATPLKDLCVSLFVNAPPAAFYGSQADKEAPLEAYPGWTGRSILQHVGTEGIRAVDPNVWSTLLLQRIENQRELCDLIVVDDVRFLDEATALSGVASIYRIDRDSCGPGEHASERDIEQIPVDGAIRNNGYSFNEFYEAIDAVLCF